MLKMCYEKNVDVQISTAASHRPEEWYVKVFEANPKAKWIFAIDGLPEESNMYRINQDGKKLFEVAKEAKKHLKQTPSWQFIVFSYNEHNLEKAKQIL